MAIEPHYNVSDIQKVRDKATHDSYSRDSAVLRTRDRHDSAGMTGAPAWPRHPRPRRLEGAVRCVSTIRGGSRRPARSRSCQPRESTRCASRLCCVRRASRGKPSCSSSSRSSCCPPFWCAAGLRSPPHPTSPHGGPTSQGLQGKQGIQWARLTGNALEAGDTGGCKTRCWPPGRQRLLCAVAAAGLAQERA